MNKLEVINVSKWYKNYQALKNVSISVNGGKVFGLLGPNGAGKTTLIRMITQITLPDTGQILLDGKTISEELVPKIGYLPEERGLYKKVKVLEQLIYLAELKGINKNIAKEKALEWLKKLGIDQWKDKKIEDLSKGMQQKIQFIATVLHHPELIILDEPFSGFDPINADIIKNEILNLKNTGAIIILSTHNMNSVEELCDDIALIHQSEVVLSGSVRHIKNQYKSNIFHVRFKGNIQAFTHALWSSAELLDIKNQANEFSVKIKLLPHIGINQVLHQILSVCEILSFNEEELSMNDIFIKTVHNHFIQDTNIASSLTE